MKTLNERFDYGLDLVLISIDEGITGYRDDSLETVKRNRDQYGLPLTILSYEELYGWTMDKIVDAVGRKNNCTFCGVFRRQALDRAGMKLKVDQIVSELPRTSHSFFKSSECNPFFQPATTRTTSPRQ